VQVACTINYGKDGCGKEQKITTLTQEFISATIFFGFSELAGEPSSKSGPVAQLGARFHGMEEVVGSIPTRSTNSQSWSLCTSFRVRVPGRFYIGCSENPVERLIEHNRGQTKSTRGRGPWKHVYQEQFTTLPEALRRERQLKSWKSHRSIQELIDCSASAERAPA
jgi:putative endonuclease